MMVMAESYDRQEPCAFFISLLSLPREDNTQNDSWDIF